GTYVVLALLVVLLRARIISLASGTPRNRGQLTALDAWSPTTVTELMKRCGVAHGDDGCADSADDGRQRHSAARLDEWRASVE
ncbi:hypothetical protein ACF1FY_30555, partial [Streptomyces althioticus]|uniref:hypothetical protein n=1 Tax=Streptomyces althioticus TaxID=83380 RepID=UPI0036FDA946